MLLTIIDFAIDHRVLHAQHVAGRYDESVGPFMLDDEEEFEGYDDDDDDDFEDDLDDEDEDLDDEDKESSGSACRSRCRHRVDARFYAVAGTRRSRRR